MKYIDAENYTQHNLPIADGLDGFAITLKQLSEDSARVDVVHVFRDNLFHAYALSRESGC